MRPRRVCRTITEHTLIKTQTQAMLRGTEVGDVLHNTFHTDILDDGMNDSPDQSPAQVCVCSDWGTD